MDHLKKPPYTLTLAEMEEIEDAAVQRALERMVAGGHADQRWPKNCPDELRRRLEEVLSMRSHGPAEIWGVVRDWLVKGGGRGS